MPIRNEQQEERMKEWMNSWIINDLSRMCQECLLCLPHHWKNLLNQSEVLAYTVDPRS